MAQWTTRLTTNQKNAGSSPARIDTFYSGMYKRMGSVFLGPVGQIPMSEMGDIKNLHVRFFTTGCSM